MELYNHDAGFQKIIKHIWALAYVPLDQVTSVWETNIQEQVRSGCLQWEEEYGPQLASFFKYVDTTWIGELNPHTKVRKNPASVLSSGRSTRRSWTATKGQTTSWRVTMPDTTWLCIRE
jgi:hypothetical protein